MKKQSIKFEHQVRNDVDLKKVPVLYIFEKRVHNRVGEFFKSIKKRDGRKIRLESLYHF